jgi:hypothetical protein
MTFPKEVDVTTNWVNEKMEFYIIVKSIITDIVISIRVIQKPKIVEIPTIEQVFKIKDYIICKLTVSSPKIKAVIDVETQNNKWSTKEIELKKRALQRFDLSFEVPNITKTIGPVSKLEQLAVFSLFP